MSHPDAPDATILVVDDEPRYVRWITVNLRASGYRVLTAGDCLKGKVTRAYSRKVKKGRVIKQSQRPGKTLKFRSKVNLVISKGKKPR